MKSDAVQIWLRKKKSWGFAQYELLGAVAFLAGIVILFLTFWLTYGIICFGWFGISAAYELICNKRLSSPSHELRLLASGIFIVLLFVQHFRTNPSYWGNYRKENYRSPSAVPFVAAFGFAFGMILAYPGASANMIVDILLTGPRLVRGTFGLIRQGFRTKNLDENNCATLLSLLLSRMHAVSYDELNEAGWEPYLDQLHFIDGVEFLQKGLFLSEELRSELGNLKTE